MSAEGKDALPSQFGRYTLTERLATGGMAEVFKAKMLSTHGFEKLLVIKRILPHLAADKTFVSMFIDEAKLTAQLVHPKIVQVSDFGEENGQFFIALEFVDGFDALALLRTSAQRHVRLPIPFGLFISIEVLDALDYAHNARDNEGKLMRLVHRDISPSNVFISHRGDVKLGDFGIAHAQERESKTQAGTLKGKYGYMSPEQVVGASLDGRSDIFAVGIVLAEMLMGKRLFTAPNDLDVLLMVRDGRLDRLDKYCRDLPADLDKILRKGLARKLSDRYQTATEFRDALSDFLFRAGVRVGPAELGKIAVDFFDTSPEAAERLTEHCKRWDLRVAAPQSAVPAAATSSATTAPRPNVEPTVASPPPVPTSAAAQPASRAATPPPRPPLAAVSPPSPPEDPVDLVIDEDISDISDVGDSSDVGETAVIPGPQAGAQADPQALAAWSEMLSNPTLVGLDQYEAPPTTGVGRFEAISPTPTTFTSFNTPPPQPMRLPKPGPPPPDLGRFVPAAQQRGADAAGDLSVISPMRVFADLAVAGDTGLLRFEIAPHIKEVYLVRGSPESVNSSLPAERFGEYLVARGFIRQSDLDTALAQLPHSSSKLGDTLVALGVMRPLDVFRLLSQQVRERVMEIFGWVQGHFSFFRGARNPQEAFPLGLDTFEILGAGVLTLPYEFLERRFMPILDQRPRAAFPPRITLEAFRLGPTPREVWGMLDGSRTLREWMSRFTSPGELHTFLRTLYLLVETGLAQF